MEDRPDGGGDVLQGPDVRAGDRDHHQIGPVADHLEHRPGDLPNRLGGDRVPRDRARELHQTQASGAKRMSRVRR